MNEAETSKSSQLEQANPLDPAAGIPGVPPCSYPSLALFVHLLLT